MLGRHTPPTPLWDGEILEAAFFLVMRDLSVSGSPLERGGWEGGFSKSMTGFSGLSPEGGIRING